MNTRKQFIFITAITLVVFLLGSLTCCAAAVRLTPANAARQARMIINKLEQAATITPQLEQETNATIQNLTNAGFGKSANQVRGILAKRKEGTRARVPGVPAAPSVSQLQEQIDELLARNNSLSDQLEERAKVNAGQAEEIKRLEREIAALKESTTGDTRRLAEEIERINKESNQTITALTAERDNATIAGQKAEAALQECRKDVEDLESFVAASKEAIELSEYELIKSSKANAEKITALTEALNMANATKQEAVAELQSCRNKVLQLEKILDESKVLVETAE